MRRTTAWLLALAFVSASTTAWPAVPAPGETPGADAYKYDPAGKRDPFRPIHLIREPNPEKTEPLTPLQRYELGQLRLVGIVHQLMPPRAMVEDSAGLGFILTPGTPVGPNGGIVTEIRPREVVVEEWQTDVIGQEHRTEHVLELPADEDGPTR